MAELEIVTFPNPILSSQALTVAWINSRIRRLAHDMLETMCAASGSGLAAPQVGVQKRVIVVDVGEDPLVLVSHELGGDSRCMGSSQRQELDES
jgi:peptide deformylase